MPRNACALIIGNGAYPEKFALRSPVNDARAVAKNLLDLKIRCIEAIDDDYEKLLQKIDEFIDSTSAPEINSSILYYSGHGLQIDNINYIVPIDYKSKTKDGTNNLISIQSIFDRMSNSTAIRIIILDACRTGDDLRNQFKEKSVEINKSFLIDGVEIDKPGLAEIRAVEDTFVAFAAGPGEVARQGLTADSLSPFTKSLVKHISSVDLPISNLTARVRQEVLNETSQMQRTWDQSSLKYPFYFNPGSHVLLAGNAMSLMGVFISFTIYSCVLLSPSVNSKWVVAGLIPVLTSLAILSTGSQIVYTRLRGTATFESNLTAATLIRQGLLKGAIGGFLGSLLASIFVTAPYYLTWENPDESFGQLWLEITYGTAAAACFLGAFTLAGSQLCIIFSKRYDIQNRFAVLKRTDSDTAPVLVGSIIGGGLAGLIAGPILTWFFGRIADRPEMTPFLLLPGATVGASVLVFAIINFDYDRLNARRLWSSGLSSVIALLSGVPFAIVVFTPLYLTGTVEKVTFYLRKNFENPRGLMAGGAAYGAPVGIVLGLVIGVAILATKKWSRKPVLE